MTRGILITNAYWQSDTTRAMRDLFLQAARDRGVQLAEMPNDADFTGIETDFVILWDKDVRLGAMLEKRGIPVFNSPLSIALCDDKTLTHLALMDQGIPLPETVICPQTFPVNGYRRWDFLDRAEKLLGWPMIIKEGRGSFGLQVYLAKDRAEAERILQSKAGEPLLLQRFISFSSGSDKRLYVVGDRVIAAMRRVNDNDFRANIFGGGRAFAYTPTAEEERIALLAAGKLGLSFAGVDLIDDRDAGGNTVPLLLEVNSNAQFVALHEVTGVNPAVHMTEHILSVIGREQKQKNG
ncbi:MAG: RimK family alpha-L-glutamate ligase [Clostridiales bacterium]|nr:RimK family alpha-L-glutamate ligase [Clostridiales bacterium]